MTMSAFSTSELTLMRETQDSSMQDTCYIQAFVSGSSAFGGESNTWPADGGSMKCGLDMRPGSERNRAHDTIVQYDATIRLPIAQVPDERDHLKVTKRFGETLGTALVFEIVGPIQQGPSGIRLQLKRIET